MKEFIFNLIPFLLKYINRRNHLGICFVLKTKILILPENSSEVVLIFMFLEEEEEERK